MRQLARRPSRHTLPIPCQVVRERDFALVADCMLNASASGFLAWPADPVLTGERLVMTFRLPDYGIWIDAEGVVARVVHGRRLGEWHRALGIDFTRIRDFSRFMLERTLRRVPYAPPTPRSPVPRVAATLQRLARSSAFPAG